MPDFIHAQGFTELSLAGADNLFAGDQDRMEGKGVLISGQNLVRGAVLGKITTGGKLTLSLSASSDGSQVPFAILAHDCDASAADKECIVYEAGTFNELALTLGTAHTIASIRAGLRDLNINLRKNIPA